MAGEASDGTMVLYDDRNRGATSSALYMKPTNILIKEVETMSEKIIENFEHPRDIAPAALQLITADGFKRIDGECMWKNEAWKFSIYKVPGVIDIIRIDLRKK